MSCDIWSRSDIRNALMASEAASNNAGGSDEYRRGHEAALGELAIAFGILQHRPVTILEIEKWRREVHHG